MQQTVASCCHKASKTPIRRSLIPVSSLWCMPKKWKRNVSHPQKRFWILLNSNQTFTGTVAKQTIIRLIFSATDIAGRFGRKQRIKWKSTSRPQLSRVEWLWFWESYQSEHEHLKLGSGELKTGHHLFYFFTTMMIQVNTELVHQAQKSSFFYSHLKKDIYSRLKIYI